MDLENMFKALNSMIAAKKATVSVGFYDATYFDMKGRELATVTYEKDRTLVNLTDFTRKFQLISWRAR